MKNNDTVEIIMASYNGEKYIKEQIDSLLNQTYENIFISIYDDGSVDKTHDIIKDYEIKYPHKVKAHINNKNLGSTKNFLKAIRKSAFDYCMLSDQDDVWIEDKVEKTLNKMKSIESKSNNNIPIVVFTDAYVSDNKLNIINNSFHKSGKLDTKKIDLPHLLMENKLIGCTMMLNKSIIKHMTKLPENIRYHDWWIALIGASFGKIEYLNEPTIYYRQHSSNVVGSKNFINYVVKAFTTLRKQKNILLATQKQAKSFYDIYKDLLIEEKKDVIYTFSRLNKNNYLKRRIIVLKYKYLKTGIIRNIGVLMLI